MARADRFDWAGKVEIDAEGLKSDDPKQRREAVRKLATDAISLSQPFLLAALRDDDRSVRLEAGQALGMRGSKAALPVLIDWLADSDPKTRSIAVDALGDIGGPVASGALTRSLGDSDPSVRLGAVRSLGELARRGSPGVVASLLPRLEDDKAQVRREAVEQLERLGDRRAVIPLVSRFADTSKDVAKGAVRAVGALGDRAAVPALIRMMGDSDENLRRLAAQSLGRLGAVEAVDALIDQLGRTTTQAFRSSVAYALGQIAAVPSAGKASETALRVLADDLANSSTRIAATEALRVAGSAAVPALVAHLAAHRKGDLSPIIALLTELGDSRATAALTAELERDRVPAPLVLHALGATRDPKALIPVLSATGNGDAAIRLAAMNALRPLLGGDTRAADVLIERLDDDNLEVRILAADYLGALSAAHGQSSVAAVAAPRLANIAASDAPLRLRVVAIGALGEMVSTSTLTAATTALVDILSFGPQELQAAVSMALSRAVDPAVLARLVSHARDDRSPVRHEVVRAIGGAMRGRSDPAGRTLLRDLVRDEDSKVAVAAVCGLAAASDSKDAAMLRALVDREDPELQRAAAWALGEIRDASASRLLRGALSSPDDRLAGAAAWALGEIAIAKASALREHALTSLADRWLHLTRFGGWSAAINGAAALGRALWEHPPSARRLSSIRRSALIGLTRHKSPLVRVNAMFALSSLTGDSSALRALAQALRADPSPHVRAAAALGLGRLGDRRAHEALEQSVRVDSDRGVVGAVKAALAGPSAPPTRNEWRTFHIVDDHSDRQRLRSQPYFVHGSDGLVWATYTDARGELTSEHIPPGTSAQNVWPADRESTY